MELFCENPRIITSPRANYLVARYHNYVIDGEFVFVDDVRNFCDGYKYKYFSPRKYNVTLENIDKFGILTDNGLEPMFLAVPCGRCVLCREKKATDWSFRALCENQSSISQPLFLTLTYNDAHKPHCGVIKRDVQLFLKRLRRNLDKLGIVHNIRYFACAEYGKNTHRPHYHLILWNFPRVEFKTVTDCLHFIEDAWRAPVLDRWKQPRYAKDGSPITQSIGFAYCVPCNNGAISYVMKYMRKDCVVPVGCNPVFYLSSRKNGGIGAPFFRKYIDFYRKNPDCLEFTVIDRWSNKSQTKKLPAYFRSLVWPSCSRLVSKEDRDVYQSFLNNLKKRETLSRLCNFSNVPLLFDDEMKLIKKWSLSGFSWNHDSIPSYYHKVRRLSPEKLNLLYVRVCDAIEYQMRYLENVDFPVQYFVSRETQLSERRKMLEENMSQKSLDIKEVKEQIISRRKLAQYKEKF